MRISHILLLATPLLLFACDREKPPANSHAADAPMGYDSRAAPGNQPSQPRPGDNARPPATQLGANIPEGTMVLADVDKQFVADAVRANDLELKLAKLAASKAGSDAVKQYAKQMLDAHGAAKPAAQAAGDAARRQPRQPGRGRRRRRGQGDRRLQEPLGRRVRPGIQAARGARPPAGDRAIPAGGGASEECRGAGFH